MSDEKPIFQQINVGWNADPVVANPTVEISGNDILLRFSLNFYQFEEFSEGNIGIVRFTNASRYILGGSNDEGWFMQQCRYSKLAPKWGEFYELIGPDVLLDATDEWRTVRMMTSSFRHFLFYFKEETFECISSDWQFEPVSENALFRHFGRK